MVTIDELKVLGNEWQKGNLHRIYFNNICDLLGMEITWTNRHGVVDYAEVNGDRLKARDVDYIKRYSKVWYDVKTGEFGYIDLRSEYFEIVVDEIKRRAETPKTKAKVEAKKQEAAQEAADLAQVSEEELAATREEINIVVAKLKTTTEVQSGIAFCDDVLKKPVDVKLRVKTRMLRAALTEALKNTPEAQFKQLLSKV